MSGVYLDESEAQRILQSLRYDLEASGGCDHSVGICSCEVVRQIDLFEDLIAGNHLTDREREQHEKKCEEQS